MTIVKNSWGKDIDYDAAVMLMEMKFARKCMQSWRLL